MVKHYWKVRMFHDDNETPIDLNYTTRKEARKYKNLSKRMNVFTSVKMFKVTPFTIPQPFRNLDGYQCEYFQEVR